QWHGERGRPGGLPYSIPPAQFAQLPPVALRWPAFVLKVELRRRFPIFRRLPACLATLFRLAIEQLRDRRRAAHFTQSHHVDLEDAAFRLALQPVADLHRVRRLRSLPVRLHAAEFARALRHRPRLEESRGPQPLVDPHAGHAQPTTSGISEKSVT